MTDKIKLLEEIIESCTDKYGDNRNEISKALFLLNEIKEAINYTRCCKTLNLEVKPTFEEWLNVNFTKYDNEYYQDSGRNGIWKKHQLYELYEDTTI